MAAPPLRDVYDCAVIGNGFTARLIAEKLAEADLSTLLIASAEPQPLSAWLHPRLKQSAAQDLPSRLPLRSVIAHDAAGVRLPPCNSLGSYSAKALSSRSNARLHLARRTDMTISANSAMPARFVVQVAGAASIGGDAAVGGVYRQVALARGEERQGMLFATQLPGLSCWLVPLDNGLCSLGVIRTDDRTTIQESPAELLEDALVACPALAARLMRAELVGALHETRRESHRPAQPAIPRAIVIPDYELLCDPLFASGHHSANQCAADLAALLAASTDAAEFQMQLDNWQAARRQRDLAAQRLIQGWYACQAPEPHALIESLLHPSPAAAPPANPFVFSVEIGNPTQPRRTISI